LERTRKKRGEKRGVRRRKDDWAKKKKSTAPKGEGKKKGKSAPEKERKKEKRGGTIKKERLELKRRDDGLGRAQSKEGQNVFFKKRPRLGRGRGPLP